MDNLSDIDAAFGATAPAIPPSSSVPSTSAIPIPDDSNPIASMPLTYDQFQASKNAVPGGSPSGTPVGTVLSDDDLSDIDAAFAKPSAAAQAPSPVQQQVATMPSLDRNVLAAARGLGNTIPFYEDIGALANTGLSYIPESIRDAASAVIPAISPGLGLAAQTLTGSQVQNNAPSSANESFSQRYGENLARQRAIDAALSTQNPIPYYGGEVGGALALPMGPVEAIGSSAARILPSAASRMLATGAVGAGYGAAYGAGEGNSLSDSLQRAGTGALVGGIGGALAPPVIGAVGSVAGALTKPIQGMIAPAQVAMGRIASNLSRDTSSASPGMAPQDILAARAANQPVSIADLGGEATQALARSAANVSPDARAALGNLVNERFESQGPRFSDFMQDMFWNGLNNQDVRDQLEAQARSANGPAYQSAYAQGANGIWNDDLASLTGSPYLKDAIQTANRKAANDAAINRTQSVQNPFVAQEDGSLALSKGKNGQTAYPTLQYWDKVKQALDGKISIAKRTGDNDSVREMTALKNALVSHLDAVVPAYAKARSGAFQFFNAENALEAGEKFLGMSKSADIAAMRKAISKMSPAQRNFFAQGLASQIAQKAENVGERRNIISLFNSPATRQKMELGLGPQRASEIAAYLQRESIMDRLRTALGNSTTARQQIESGMAEGKESHGLLGTVAHALGSPFGGALSAGIAAHEVGAEPMQIVHSAMAGFAAGLIGKFVKTANQNVVKHIGEMLASDDPIIIKRAVQQISRNKDLAQALQHAEAATMMLLGHAGANQGVKELAPQ